MTNATEQRKLAAIMFTDMVGYSALSQRDDKLALELLEEHRALLREIFPRFNGTEIKTIGDAFLVEFNSALEAAQCAIEIQRALARRNSDIAPDRRIEVRIGIHIGDVVHRGGDVYGDGVNIASRVQPLANAGGICVSMDVERQIHNAIETRLEKLAPTELKNISVPMDLFRIVLPWERQRSETRGQKSAVRNGTAAPTSRRFVWVGALAVLLIIGIGWWWTTLSQKVTTIASKSDNRAGEAATKVPEKSIAVLPFESLSEDKSNAYFADGIQDEILARLSKIADLKVISRTSTQKYKSAPDNLREIAQQLGVSNILEGSVQKSGDQVRITVQLINALKDEHLWADTYDRSMSNIFSVETDVAQKIAESLEAKLTGREKKEIAFVGTRNPAAYDAYLRALALRGAQSIEASKKQRGLLEQAVQLDPNYAQAWALLGQAEALDYFNDPGVSDKEKSRAAVETSSRLAPDLADTQMAKGVFDYYCLRDYDTALTHLTAAQEAAPNNGGIAYFIALVQRRQGKIDQAIRGMEQASALDPLNEDILVNLGNTYRGMRKFDEARAMFDRALTIAPNDPNIRAVKAETYLAQGNLDDAWSIVSKLKLSPEDNTFGVFMSILGARRQFNEMLTQARAIDASAKDYSPIVQHIICTVIALLYLAKREQAAALPYVERARKDLEQSRQEKEVIPVLQQFYIDMEARLDNRAEVEKLIAELYDKTRNDQWEFPNSQSAAARGYALLGDADHALPLLEQALSKASADSITVSDLQLGAEWDAIRNDPRFQKLCQKKEP